MWYHCDFMLCLNIVCAVVSLGLKKHPCSVGYMLLLLGILTHALYFESRMQWHGLNSSVSSQYSVPLDGFGTWSFLLARLINSLCMNVSSCKDHPTDPVKLQGSRVVTGERIFPFDLHDNIYLLFAFFFFFFLFQLLLLCFSHKVLVWNCRPSYRSLFIEEWTLFTYIFTQMTFGSYPCCANKEGSRRSSLKINIFFFLKKARGL